MRSVDIIANPNAAGGRGKRILPELERALDRAGVPYTLQRTEASGHARRLATDARERGTARILVVGGDGTIHEVVCGLMEGRSNATTSSTDLPAVAVLPIGTGNDFFRMVDAAEGVDAAVEALQHGSPRIFEVGTVRWEGGEDCFVNLLGVGIDVEVLRQRPNMSRLPGLLQYLGALGLALIRYRPLPLRVTLRGSDGSVDVLEGPALLSAVTVGPSIGGGFYLSPDARPDDGLVDLCLVMKLSLWKVARYLPGILSGSGVNRPEIVRRQVLALRIERTDGQAMRFELDGELMDEQTPFLEVGLRPGGLRILERPKGTA